jgi:hypothetical protein
MFAPKGERGSVYLDSLTPLLARVGYGQLGLQGGLGYEGKRIAVQRRPYAHAISSHPPARLLFQLGGRFAHFRCGVALNDDVPPGATAADFIVLADGRQAGVARNVESGATPRILSVAVSGAQRLELIVETGRWQRCHAVWLDPRLQEEVAPAAPRTVVDCLERTEISFPGWHHAADRCIATIMSPGFEPLLDDLLGSLRANACCDDALLLVLAVECTESCRRVAERHGALVMDCRRRSRLNSTVKAALYTVPALVDAKFFVCLDADMLVLGDLRPVFAALEACPEGSVLACREANGRGLRNLGHAISCVYQGHDSDFARILGSSNGESGYPLVVNDGIFAGSRNALMAVDDLIRSWTMAPRWVDERLNVWWRNQFVFNLALARLHCGVELDPTYNIQLNCQDVHLCWRDSVVHAYWHGRRVRILHFNGWGRRKYPEWRGLHRSAGRQ